MRSSRQARVNRRARPFGGRVALAALALLLVVPMLLSPSASAQDEQPLIEPILGEDPVAVVDGEPVVLVDDPAPAVPIGEEPATVPEVVEEVAPAPAPAAAPPVAQVEVAAAPAPVPAADWSPPSTVYIPETGQSIDGVFLDVWRAWGGSLSFGYPITPEIEENGRIVQYYGYARFEYWPEDPGGNVVQFGDLGAEMRPFMIRRGQPGTGTAVANASLAARAWMELDPATIEADSADWRFVPETGHGVRGAIKALWEATGEATYLGNPMSEPYVLNDITYQVFENGKVAQEPGGNPYLLPSGELMATRYALPTVPVAQADLPVYSEELFVPPPAPTPSPVEAEAAPELQLDSNAEKWLQISLSQQYATARQGDVVVWEGYVSTGKAGFETPPGTFFVNNKLPVQDMEGVLGGEYYNVPEVPDVMYFTDRGHAIHGTYWHNNFGAPMSHGCINLPMDVSAWMYDWAPMGMRVEIVA